MLFEHRRHEVDFWWWPTLTRKYARWQSCPSILRVDTTCLGSSVVLHVFALCAVFFSLESPWVMRTTVLRCSGRVQSLKFSSRIQHVNHIRKGSTQSGAFSRVSTSNNSRLANPSQPQDAASVSWVEELKGWKLPAKQENDLSHRRMPIFVQATCASQ